MVQGDQTVMNDSSENLEQPVPGTGQRLAVVGARDGVGKTTLAVNLAVAFAQSTDASVALVDCDGGDAALMLDLLPERGFSDLREFHEEDVDGEVLSHYALTHASGVTVYPGHAKVDYAESASISARLVGAALTVLAATHPWVVEDIPALHPGHELSRVREFDTVLLVMTSGTLLEVRAASALLKALNDCVLDPTRLMVVCNCCEAHPLLRKGDVEQHLGQVVTATLPYERKAALDAVNLGSPVVLSHPRTALARGLRCLARQLLEQKTDLPPSERIGSLGPR
ncbi:MAG: hypothetical protein COS85_24965 [Armatimonadetes bacterium CG07_land_8_20_14_0_80_59_28]|nr:MAG: hypothetical protein COS85_24965 [Armatimonadetes bacterium CG07_land_8_20_14_0_80_59_28]PIX45676.1 MAG: hypothetical protein COZ56_01335 [Armatimonadetes bacterium CG_4_8_14_3_um_filter_58_9]PIY39535.1 MAG: hypothetical protein COZ05_19115 [Armatimonadetes bacterium CG_4_10_14_3_um_filter_59_10]